MSGLDTEHEMNYPSSELCPQPLSEKVSELELGVVSNLKSSIEADTFFTSSWEPNEIFGGFSTSVGCKFSTSHYSALLENEGVKTTSHLVNDPSNLSYDVFGNGSFSEIVDFYGFLPEVGRMQVSDIKCSYSIMPNLDAGSSERASTNYAMAQGDQVTSSSPNGKRRKLTLGSTSSNPNKNAEENLNTVPIEDFSDVLRKEDKLPKVEQRIYTKFNSKSDDKQIEENSQSVKASKENYIHLRARRGQATNSHSLAERVRREKISERMKFLQELVPGCNQITGKAMMLDEIINYVQSLQQQVEFLSMKLANVYPELNFDSQQILFTDILHSQGVDRGFATDSQLTTSLTVPHSIIQFHETMPSSIVPLTPHQVPSFLRRNDERFFGFQGDNHNV